MNIKSLRRNSIKLGTVAINYVLPPKATQRDAIVNFLGAPRHQLPNFDGFIYIHYAAPPYSAHISAIYFLPFFQSLVGFRLPCATPGNEAERIIYGGRVRTPVLV